MVDLNSRKSIIIITLFSFQTKLIFMTFSKVAYDPKNNEWGASVQSKFVAIGAVVPFAKAGMGCIATQAHSNTIYGPKGLELLENGLSAEKIIQIFEIYDMCLLLRDDSKDIVKPEEEVMKTVRERLILDGFHKGNIKEDFDDATRKALSD
jgi:hypothetical protein